jgi:PPOX class probable F420-dependent enzyme
VPKATATLSPAVRGFLGEELRFAFIATNGADGAPHQTVIWYLLDEEGVLINALVGRRWANDLQRDPRIALAVADDDIAAERTVTLQGEAVVSATGPQALRDIQTLGRKYGTDPAYFEGLERVSFRVVPRSVNVHGDIESRPGRD